MFILCFIDIADLSIKYIDQSVKDFMTLTFSAKYASRIFSDIFLVPLESHHLLKRSYCILYLSLDFSESKFRATDFAISAISGEVHETC